MYAPDQAEEVLPFVRRPLKWLVIGGPADANEAETVVKHHNGCRVLLLEPVPNQVTVNTPNTTLIPMGLGAAECEMEIRVTDPARRSSMVRDVEGRVTRVKITTVDILDKEHGPFTDGLLWLDIEGMELSALRGAYSCLKRNAFQVINVELCPEERPDDCRRIHELLIGCGYRPCKDWGVGGLPIFNRVYSTDRPTDRLNRLAWYRL